MRDEVIVLPESQTIEDIMVISPPELIAYKVMSYYGRRGKPKAGTDWRDLAMLLLTFPELKSEAGAVNEKLLSLNARKEVIKEWQDLVSQEISLPDEDDEFN